MYTYSMTPSGNGVEIEEKGIMYYSQGILWNYVSSISGD